MSTPHSEDLSSAIEVDDYYDAAVLNPAALRVKDRKQARCPVHGCSAPLEECAYNKRWRLPYCSIHAIRLHPNLESPTFVYYNGEDLESKKRARLRNFRCEQSFVEHRVLNNPKKAETHRLGYENSEDALSWNVFVPLLEAGRLADAMQWFLSGHPSPITQEPQLYLWGGQVDIRANRFDQFGLLDDARKIFEPKKEVRRFPTEPDIMLITDNMVMCIEAKFTSGNPLALEMETADAGDKPKSRAGLIARYAERWPESTRYLQRDALERAPLHSQLFRNVIFASWMAKKEKKDWHVVNLVSATQWGKRSSRRPVGYDFTDPTPAVRKYLNSGYQDHFTFCTWEGLYQHVIRRQPEIELLSAYLKGKTAHLERAFDLAGEGLS